MIPRSFVDQYGQELSNPVLLTLPSGVKWKVNWTKRDDDIWFRKVWERFAQYYSLNYGHFLLFRYEGRSKFKVLIFAMSAIEIDYSSIRCTNDGEGSNKRNEDVEKSDVVVEIIDIDDIERPRSPLAQPYKKMKINTAGEYRSHFNPLSENESAPSHRAKRENTKINLGLDATPQSVTGKFIFFFIIIITITIVIIIVFIVIFIIIVVQFFLSYFLDQAL